MARTDPFVGPTGSFRGITGTYNRQALVSDTGNIFVASPSRHPRSCVHDVHTETDLLIVYTSQGELETLVEMLSNVLARKRLRASQSEVDELTKAVRGKRIELEESLLNIAVTEALETQGVGMDMCVVYA